MTQQRGDFYEVIRDVNFRDPDRHEGDRTHAVEQDIDERSDDQHDGRHGRVGRG